MGGFLLKYQNVMILFMEFTPNPGKNLIVGIKGKKFARYPVRTHLISENDNIVEVAEKYVKPYLKAGDVVFIGEKVVSITQKRAYELDKIKPGRLARFLVRFVKKSPYGIGLAIPETMQLAVEEVGVLRMLLAAFFAALTKPFGVKGVFYMVAGPQARGVDGPVDYAIPPYNKQASKIPKDAGKVAQQVSDIIGVPVAIVDACDMGAWIVGKSKGVNKEIVLGSLKDNPLGQTSQQTPMGIIREIRE